mmetsp:Transcript_17300/g.43128  ORF Transcript_17300/g.43128 Transcript_17300/m.43128 type:complete len:88 (+) Transcript_17300:361-624(+)
MSSFFIPLKAASPTQRYERVLNHQKIELAAGQKGRVQGGNIYSRSKYVQTVEQIDQLELLSGRAGESIFDRYSSVNARARMKLCMMR